MIPAAWWYLHSLVVVFIIHHGVITLSSIITSVSPPNETWREPTIIRVVWDDNYAEEEEEEERTWWSSQFHLPPTLMRRWRPGNDAHYHHLTEGDESDRPELTSQWMSHWDIKSGLPSYWSPVSSLSDPQGLGGGCCVPGVRPGVTNCNCKLKVSRGFVELVSCPLISAWSQIEKYQHKNWLSVRGAALSVAWKFLLSQIIKNPTLMIQNNGDFK